MTTVSLTSPRAASTWSALLRTESRLLARQPAILIWTVILPVAAIIVMAAIPAARRPQDGFGGLSVLQAYQPTLMIFASSMMALQMLPVLLGQYRELGYLRRLRTTPVSPWQLLGALLVLMLLVTMAIGVLMAIVPLLVGVGEAARAPSILGVLLPTTLAFLAVGALIAAVIPSSRVAGGAGAALAAVMWFAAGMWFPRAMFPGWLAAIADWTPGGAAAAAMTDVAVGAAPGWQPFVCLALWFVVSLAIAVRAFRWE
ncbi:ABC transporter permease [Ammonicoccus fulvus]|uniref:ABC transporter permease n=1 Tax=Ammonicoccus fulvus TaxID=3138240 RepID=A0ABZ3FMN8_9ACTN